MTLLGLTPGVDIFYSEHEGIDWNVIFLLLGMMVIVGVIKQTGLFDFLAHLVLHNDPGASPSGSW